MSHSHGHGLPTDDDDTAVPGFVASRTVTVAIRSAVGVAAAITVLGLIAFWPASSTRNASDPTVFQDPPIKATVIDVTTAPCTGTSEADQVFCNFAGLRLDGQPEQTTVVPRGGGQSTPSPGPTIVGSLAGREIIATEVIRALVGSIGLVSAVPITTWLAVTALAPNPAHDPTRQPIPTA